MTPVEMVSKGDRIWRGGKPSGPDSVDAHSFGNIDDQRDIGVVLSLLALYVK